MEKWMIALEKFLSDWKDKDKIIGVLVCGSFVTGGASKHSDIDVQIILDNEVTWRERGNKIVDVFLIEYFANPLYRYEGYFEEDYSRNRTVTAHMFATGKIIFDKTGDLTKLVVVAKKFLKKKFVKPKRAFIEMNKYHLWDALDNLGEVLDNNSKEFYFVYYSGLRDIYEVYSKFCRMNVSQSNKVERFLINKKDREKYLINDFPDEVFVKLFSKALVLNSPKKMFSNYKCLCLHVFRKMGGFEIDGWKFRSPAK